MLKTLWLSSENENREFWSHGSCKINVRVYGVRKYFNVRSISNQTYFKSHQIPLKSLVYTIVWKFRNHLPFRFKLRNIPSVKLWWKCRKLIYETATQKGFWLIIRWIFKKCLFCIWTLNKEAFCRRPNMMPSSITRSRIFLLIWASMYSFAH